ncbi:hypothetical protein VAEU17_250034 [Vibrio aestuarianus]|nr:hypothetical protein VAEU17_250034 [Vibrio aestuarianus]
MHTQCKLDSYQRYNENREFLTQWIILCEISPIWLQLTLLTTTDCSNIKSNLW